MTPLAQDVRIEHATSEEELGATYEVMRQLRPHLDQREYVTLVQSLARTEGLHVLALVADSGVRAVATYRFIRMLYCDRILCIDDLVTDVSSRSRGYGSALLGTLKQIAIEHDCREIQLISRVTREAAHRFYFREGFGIECFHFRLPVTSPPTGSE